MVLRPHRSRHRPNKTVPPGHDGSDFFLPISPPILSLLRRYRFPAPHRVRAIALPASLHLIFSSHLSAACLRICFLLLEYSHIHIAPLLAPLPSTRMDGEGMVAIRLTWAA